MATRTEIDGPVERAKELLWSHGYACRVTADDMAQWFRVETRHVDIDLETVLRTTLLVVHEVVEIDVVKRMGIRLARDAIVRNPERVAEAHARAAEVELELAAAMRDFGHIVNRLHDMKSWCENPSVSPRLRRRYEALYDQACRVLDTSEPARSDEPPPR